MNPSLTSVFTKAVFRLPPEEKYIWDVQCSPEVDPSSIYVITFRQPVSMTYFVYRYRRVQQQPVSERGCLL